MRTRIRPAKKSAAVDLTPWFVVILAGAGAYAAYRLLSPVLQTAEDFYNDLVTTSITERREIRRPDHWWENFRLADVALSSSQRGDFWDRMTAQEKKEVETYVKVAKKHFRRGVDMYDAAWAADASYVMDYMVHGKSKASLREKALASASYSKRVSDYLDSNDFKVMSAGVKRRPNALRLALQISKSNYPTDVELWEASKLTRRCIWLPVPPTGFDSSDVSY